MSETVKNGMSEDKIRIADEVIATIAGIAAAEVENLASMSGGFVDGIAGMLGRKNLGKGIRVEIRENDVSIDMYIVIQYGCKIHEVARDIQVKVRDAVEMMTGLQVAQINIHIVGISIDKEVRKVQVVDELPPGNA